ncbi:MAG TPA: GIY-YIG nuclease family protein [Patescibacteria group bacterium]
MAWFTYILECRDGTLYTGITTDLEKRVIKHNDGTAAKYTATRRPVKMLWHESCADRSTATKRELEIKSLSRQEKLKLLSSGAE